MNFLNQLVTDMCKKNIGIITFHSDTNYGAFLQAFALTQCLRLEGYKASIIDYRKIPNVPHYGLIKSIASRLFDIPRSRRYFKFIAPMLSNVLYYSFEVFKNRFSEEFDVLVSGSDQIWNPKCTGDVLNPAYFLAFVSKEKYKKISYASSIGSYVYNIEEQKYVSKWLGEYAHLSSREQQGADQLMSFLNKNVKVVLDPTLLLDREEWISHAERVNLNEKYVLVYYIDELEEVMEYARNMADKIGAKVALISNMINKPKGVDIIVRHCGPAQFLWLFDNAEYICTNSFHGTAFAVNFNKNFVSILKRNSPQRQQTLLRNVGLISRLLDNISQLGKLPLKVDFSEANKMLAELRQDSLAYLISAIEK